MLNKKRKKTKKVRYRIISFKLSQKQKKSLDNYCKARKTTPTKLIKRSIKNFIEKFDKEVPQEYYITEKQLDLFDEEKNKLKKVEYSNN
ncbi:MAG: hypothetical protein K8R58_01165 [Bacteroidales bacterium]|nr:hypothetical protein [Bacteroidales bacterium]